MIPRSRPRLRRPAVIGAATLSSVALAATLTGSAVADTTTPGPGAGRSVTCPATVTAPGTAGTSAPTATLSPAVAEGLAFAREEERMARDLYATLAAVHAGALPMSMITASEQRHYDAVGTMLNRYGLADPSAGQAAGTYAFPELQKLYDDWYARGKTSLAAAYQVGIELEQRDIADLKQEMALDNPADVTTVYTNLLAGSENHLAAYQRAASGTMGRGTPGQGQGPRQGQGRGPGRGSVSG